MTFDDWRALSPAAAAREFLTRVQTRLGAAQRRAVFSHLPDERTLTEAFARAGRAQPLGGVPFAIKDLFDLDGVPTWAGSTFLPEVRPTPTSDSAFVRALRTAGAVPMGKTQLHEFAYGITGENPHYGDCEHPHFPGRTTGGSSSGSAAAVAAGIVPLALGSDTGGSVRVPAAFCGVWGFRMSPREPWIADAFPLAPSFDTAGWFTATAADMRTAYAALVGSRPATRSPRGCFLAPPGLDHEVANAFHAAASRLGPVADLTTGDALLGAFLPSVQTYNTIVADEAWAVHHSWAERFRERYDPAVWSRLNRVHALTAEQRAFAQAHAAALRQTWTDFFRTYDFLVLPATPCAALTKAECTLENRTRILTLTAPASIGGLPVLTIPVPLPSGLTTGLQVVVPDAQSPVIDWALEQFGP